LWQERFSSFVMDALYLLACTRYIENNPVRAKLVGRAEQWAWSSAGAHISGQNDNLVNVAPLLSIIKDDWRNFLAEATSSAEINDIRQHEQTGRPLGDVTFVSHLEDLFGRRLRL
jgi:putative transposase